MRLLRTASLSLVALTLAACSKEPVSTTVDEALAGPETELAANFAAAADSSARRERSITALLLHRFFGELRSHDNPEARQLLAESRALADSGRAAAQAGDRDTARGYFQAAHEALFDAVALVLPEAYERTGTVVDHIVARITARLGDRLAPRIRRVLSLVTELRTSAGAAAAGGDEGHGLALNVRALDILRALHRHLQQPGAAGLPGDQGSGPPPTP